MWRAEETCRESMADTDSIGRALLSAGTALFMAACLKRAVVLFLVEQWRIWVFLVLNLILVAIFFTSTPSNYSEIQSQSQDASAKIKQQKKTTTTTTTRENRERVEKVEIEQRQIDLDKEKEIEEEEEEEEIGLSKEELNERVEAFIVMFKKQLISDARRLGGNRGAPLSYNIQ